MKKTSRYFFVGFILLVFCAVIYLFTPFLIPMSVGILLAVSTSSLNHTFLVLTGNKNILAASLTTIALTLLFLAPFLYAVTKLAIYGANFDTAYIGKVFEYIRNFDISLPGAFSSWESRIKSFIDSINLTPLLKQGATYLSNIGKSSANFMLELVLILVFYFFANIYGKSLIAFIKDTTPVETEYIDKISGEVGNTMAVVLYSTIATSVLQGLLFGIMIVFFGYDGLLLGIVYAFASMLPVVGGTLVYIPISIYEFAMGNKFAGIFILIYSIVMISTVADNFVKPFLIKFINSKLVKHPANINELLIFFAMMAGLSTFGFWGLILGPAIVTLFVACLNAYRIIEKDDLLERKNKDIILSNSDKDDIKNI